MRINQLSNRGTGLYSVSEFSKFGIIGRNLLPKEQGGFNGSKGLELVYNAHIDKVGVSKPF
jgi:hypothetical protein